MSDAGGSASLVLPGVLRRHALGVSVLLATLAVLATYGEILEYHLLGHDTLPDILASRVTSVAELPSLLTEPLMEGMFRIGYWRPVLNATFALDHALWGLAPFGYQLTDLLVFLGATLAIFLLTRRLLGADAIAGPLLAALVFTSFPLHVEIVPIPSRRNHTLCCMFMALALAAMVRGRDRSGWRSYAAPALLAFLAMGSNEIGLSLPGSFFLVALLLPARSGGRLRAAIVSTLPALAALALAMLARWSVLGGLGGPQPPRLSNLGGTLELLRYVLYPQSTFEGDWIWLTALAVAALCGLLLAVSSGSVVTPDGERAPGPAWVRTVLAGAAWTLVVTLLIASVGRMRPWYFMHPSAGVAVAAGGLLQGCLANVWAPARARRLTAVSGVCALTIALLLLAASSPLGRPSTQRLEASERMGAFLQDLEERLPAAPDGTTLRSMPMPVRGDWPSGTGISHPPILGPQSVPAWVRLRYPDRHIEVQLSNARPKPVPPDGVLLVVDVEHEADR